MMRMSIKITYLRVPPLLSERENENFFDFLFFIRKYTLKGRLSIYEKKSLSTTFGLRKKTMNI